MRNLKTYIAALSLLSMTACHGLLDIEPTNKITLKDLFKDPEGVKSYMATLYRMLPIEDYLYMPGSSGEGGFNNPTGNIGLFWLANVSGEAVQSQWGEEGPGYLIRADYFNQAYINLRDINFFKNSIPTLEVGIAEKNVYMGEAAFMTAYNYFYLAQKFGGVPIIKKLQEFDPVAPENLVVPRSTEVDTWKYVMEQCDTAAKYLPANPADRRASKWAALALKSRAALVAASVAKFGSNIKITGEAVTMGLAGMKPSDAEYFYNECIEASQDIMQNSHHKLYKPSPSDRFEAEKNFKSIFSNPNSTDGEAIFVKGIGKEGSGFASSMNYYLEPPQTNGIGRMSPTLEFVDMFETYEDVDGVRSERQIKTRTADDYNTTGFNSSYDDYIKVDRAKPYQLFDGTAFGDPKMARDARLWASVIIPGTQWKNTTIIIQGGLIKPNGEQVYRSATTVEGLDGKSYHALGGERAEVSGFYNDSHTMSGFLMRKMISESCLAEYHKSTTDYIVFRFGEVLLNYAEAVCESGLGDAAEAKKALNALRKRAAHTNDIPLTRENVRAERGVELAFENIRVWDMKRWRILHDHYTGSRYHQILVPMLDLRDADPKMIFVRRTTEGASLNGAKSYSDGEYYEDVPRNSINNMIQNP